MSLQSYFNHRKSILVSFFTHFQQLIHELSIAVQLEVDNQYFCARNLMGEASRDTIERYCRDMAGKESLLMGKIIDSIYEHVKGYQFRPLECVAGPEKPNAEPDVQVKEREINRVMSVDQLNRSQLNTVSKGKNPKGIETVTKTSRDLFNMKTSSKQLTAYPSQQKTSAESSKIQKQPEPVNLLNKKRQSSSRKQTEVNKQQESMTYNKYRQQQQAQQASTRPPSTIEQKNVSYHAYQKQDLNPKEGYIQTNQILCESLDQKIHESAMEILNKVKPKRSPGRRKVYQSVNKVNRTVNAFSLYGVSDSAIPTRPNILRMHTQQRS